MDENFLKFLRAKQGLKDPEETIDEDLIAELYAEDDLDEEVEETIHDEKEFTRLMLGRGFRS